MRFAVVRGCLEAILKQGGTPPEIDDFLQNLKENGVVGSVAADRRPRLFIVGGPRDDGPGIPAVDMRPFGIHRRLARRITRTPRFS